MSKYNNTALLPSHESFFQLLHLSFGNLRDNITRQF